MLFLKGSRKSIVRIKKKNNNNNNNSTNEINLSGLSSYRGKKKKFLNSTNFTNISRSIINDRQASKCNMADVALKDE